MISKIIKEEEGIIKSDSCFVLKDESINQLLNKTKTKILKILSQKPMYISEIAKELNTNEQNIYYHIKELKPILEIVNEKKIRGVFAKQYKIKSNNICLNIKDGFRLNIKKPTNSGEIIHPFFRNFICEKTNTFNAKFIVGSPDPHGKFKARCRDGHYAIDLSFFIGNFCSIPSEFTVSLDVDTKLKNIKSNLIVVGGPVTNLIMNYLIEFLPVKFQQEKQWAIKTLKEEYTDDNTGIIAKIPHPCYPEFSIIVIAGIRFSGTKAAVVGLTRQTNLVLNKYKHQKDFFAIIQGFDLDGDGKIDSVELLE